MELFSFFSEVLLKHIVDMVGESQRVGHLHGAINSTFIAMIPNNENFDTFQDFRPISLCNITYKIISKTIVEHLKGVLSRQINRE